MSYWAAAVIEASAELPSFPGCRSGGAYQLYTGTGNSPVQFHDCVAMIVLV